MFDQTIPYEENLFFLINGAHTHFLDNVMWLYSGLKIWMPLAVLVIINIIYKRNWRQWLIVLLAIILLFILCDQISSHIIKPLVARSRPTHFPGVMEHVKILYNYTGGSYGFISGHATNCFGFAAFMALLFRNKVFSIVIFSWATIMAYSRIYLGVHFISDILGGIMAGLIIGLIIYKIYYYTIQKIQQKSKIQFNTTYPIRQINVMSIVIVLYILSFCLLSEYLIIYLK